MLSSTEWTYRYPKNCKQPCHGHFRVMPKGQNFVVLLLLPLCHTFYFHNFSGTVADRDLVNTPLEPFWPTDVLLGNYKPEPITLGRILTAKSKYVLGCHLSVNKISSCFRPRWQLRWTYFSNHYNVFVLMNLHPPSKSNANKFLALFWYVCLLRLAISTCVLCKECSLCYIPI